MAEAFLQASEAYILWQVFLSFLEFPRQAAGLSARRQSVATMLKAQGNCLPCCQLIATPEGYSHPPKEGSYSWLCLLRLLLALGMSARLGAAIHVSWR